MSTIQLRLAKSRLARWHRRLVEDLRRDGHVVDVELRDEAPRAPSALAWVEQLERLVYQRGRPSECDPIAAGEWSAGAAALPDIVFDLTGAAEPPADAIAPHYDGVPGDAARDAALLSGLAPALALAQRRDGELHVFAEALPAIERRPLLSQGRVAVAQRLGMLIRGLAAERPPAAARRLAARPVGAGPAFGYLARALATTARGRLLRLLAREGHWRIGWRSLAGHPPVSETLAWPTGKPWRWLRDDGRRYFADPFPFRFGGKTHVFCEEYPYATGKGIISVFTLGDDGRASAPRPVLERPYHLSYPFVFEHAGQIWMMPESSANQTLELYRADPFPDRWALDRTLLGGLSISDATAFECEGRWWMLGATQEPDTSSWDCLSLFSGASAIGPWTPSGRGPVLIDASCARPAGRVVSRSGAPWRPAQDCTRGYGSGLALCRIDGVGDGAFRQSVGARLGPPAGSPSEGVHTLNADGAFELIDAVGWRMGKHGSGEGDTA
jgi:hypothetical protein